MQTVTLSLKEASELGLASRIYIKPSTRYYYQLDVPSIIDGVKIETGHIINDAPDEQQISVLISDINRKVGGLAILIQAFQTKKDKLTNFLDK